MAKRSFDPAMWNELGFDIWYKSEPVRNLRMLMASMKSTNKRYLMKSKHDGMTVSDLVESYIVSNKKRYKNYQKVENRKNQERFGEYILLYLGRNMHLTQQLKVVNEFILQMTYGEHGLPYIVYTSSMKDSVWVHIWIGDREYMKDEARVYTRDYYQNSEGKMCAKSDPGAILVRKKGDPQKDASGEPILTSGWRQKKTRIFAESYKTVRPRMHDTLIAIYYKVFRQINAWVRYKSTWTADRLRLNREAPEWKNTKYRELAALQYYIKYVIHRLLTDDIDNYKHYDMQNVGYKDVTDPPTVYSRKLLDLFNKYKAVFKKPWTYQDELKENCNIMYGKFNVTMDHIRHLKVMFKAELTELVQTYN